MFSFKSKNSTTISMETKSKASLEWIADMETGDLSQWQAYPGQQTSFDSGICNRPTNGVSQEQSHSGKYSMKMTAYTAFKNPINKNSSGCRQFRYPEALSGEPLYYGAWYFLPTTYHIDGWSMLGQFKSKANHRKTSDPVWSWGIVNDEGGQMFLQLKWKADMDGPFESDGYRPFDTDRGILNSAWYEALEKIPMPVNTWFHLELYLKQAEDYTGELVVRQDGRLIFDMKGIKTKYPNSTNSFSVTSYGLNTIPAKFTLYVDDVSISKSQYVYEQ